MALVKITQERSKIRCMEKHKRTLEALGLRRINHSVIHEDTPQIRGMVQLVRYLVRMEPADAVTAMDSSGAPRPRKKGAPRKRAAPKKKKKGAGAASSARSKARAASGARKKARSASGLNIKGKKRVPRS
jgi:large subunit ribosomal protein L30